MDTVTFKRVSPHESCIYVGGEHVGNLFLLVDSHPPRSPITRRRKSRHSIRLRLSTPHPSNPGPRAGPSNLPGTPRKSPIP